MTKTNPIPEDIGEFIDYHPETGICTWKQKTAIRVKVGDLAGSVQTDGYMKVHFRGKPYLLHRVAWFIHYGEDPGEQEVDHMNGDRGDNRITNLRLVTRQENMHNTVSLGITFRKRTGKWEAQIQLDKKKRHLGAFDCPLMAGLAYKEAKKQFHPTAAR